MQELASIAPAGDVDDDVERFARRFEGSLDAGVEARRDDQLLREAAFAQHGRQGREPGVEQRRFDIPVERQVQLVVEGPDPVSGRNRL